MRAHKPGPAGHEYESHPLSSKQLQKRRLHAGNYRMVKASTPMPISAARLKSARLSVSPPLSGSAHVTGTPHNSVCFGLKAKSR
jgi:hypothetical protein